MTPAPFQNPTVGRVVHYVSHGSPVRADGSQEYTPECRAAVVTQVNSPTDVGLCVLNPTGQFFRESVLLDGQYSTGGTWHWPDRTD